MLKKRKNKNPPCFGKAEIMLKAVIYFFFLLNTRTQTAAIAATPARQQETIIPLLPFTGSAEDSSFAEPS